jgi:hypothetical protein
MVGVVLGYVLVYVLVTLRYSKQKLGVLSNTVSQLQLREMVVSFGGESITNGKD